MLELQHIESGGALEDIRALFVDTIAGTMDQAIALYHRLGFREISAYCENPIPGAAYFELRINPCH